MVQPQLFDWIILVGKKLFSRFTGFIFIFAVVKVDVV
jgi:hypothetical protein